MSDLLIAMLSSQIMNQSGLEELLTELTHRLIDLEKKVKKMEGNK